MQTTKGLSLFHRFLKRSFDVILSFFGLLMTWWLIAITYVVSSLDTGASGFFIQTRVGRKGKLFKVVKIRTMKEVKGVDTSVTTKNDCRITRIGGLLRATKLDELPQLWNVLMGDMSFVGPRPDVPGFADRLEGDDRLVLEIRPGITGPATLAFRNEESLLAAQANPEQYNAEVIFPEKVRLNREYIQNYHFFLDIKYILQTVFPMLDDSSNKVDQHL